MAAFKNGRFFDKLSTIVHVLKTKRDVNEVHWAIDPLHDH
jgi:hypothetical protein